MVTTNRPFISCEVVQRALDSLRYSTAPQDGLSALHYLAIVDEHLISSDYPKTPHARDMAIQHILTSIIRDEYNTIRRKQNMPSVSNADMTVEMALSYIRADVQDQHAELIGWSCLFFHYVGVDLNFSTESYGKTANFAARTVRRYRTYGVERLTKILIEREKHTRKLLRRKRLAAQLPAYDVPFVNRHDEFKFAEETLKRKGPAHFHITGLHGIGKTRFAREIVRRIIHKGEVTDLIWVVGPLTVFELQLELEDTLLPANSLFSLKDVVYFKQIVIVLDDMDVLLQTELAHVNALLEKLRNATVFITSQDWYPIHTISLHLPLKALSRDDTILLIQHHYQNLPKPPDIPIEHLWKRVGGNPLAINLATVSGLDVDIVTAQILHEVYGGIFDSLSETQKAMCLMLCLFEVSWVSFDELSSIWGEKVDVLSIKLLSRCHLIEGDGKQFHLSTAAFEFIKDSYHTFATVRSEINTLVDDIDRCVDHTPEIVVGVCGHILASGWIQLSRSRKIRWIERLSELALYRIGDRAKWRSVLQRYCAEVYAHTGWKIRYAMYLRQNREWGAGIDVLLDVIETAGFEGDFESQATALIEMAATYRLQGLYSQAMACIERVIPTENTNLFTLVQIEKAQIAVDLRDGKRAIEILDQVPTGYKTIAIYLLLADALIVQEDYTQAQQILDNLLSQSEVADDLIRMANIYNGLGRCHISQGHIDRAIHYFSLALMLFEAVEDYYHLARIKSNLAACLIKIKRYEEARQLLMYAEDIQRQMQDRIGLETTLHNILLVRTAIAKN